MASELVEFSLLDDKSAEKEGWCISLCSLVSGEEEYQIQRLDELEIFESDEDAWKFIVEKANSGSELHKKAIKFMENHNFDNIEKLSMVFFEKPTKDDIPSTCTRCRKAKVENLNFRGAFPNYSNICKWWKNEESGWSLSIELKRPRYYLDGVDYKKDAGKMVIKEVHCPSCQKEVSDLFNDILSELK